MTTLEPEQKDILEKLNEIALEANWGGKDRVYTAEAPNGVPKAVAAIQEAIIEITKLRKDVKYWENAWFEKDRREDNLIIETQRAERERYEKVTAITIEQAKKFLAKGILQTVFEKVKEISAKSDCMLDDESVYEDSSLINVLNIIGKPYGVTLEEKN